MLSSTVAPLLLASGIFYDIRACKEATAYAVRLGFFHDQCGPFVFILCQVLHMSRIGPKKCQLNKHHETLISLKIHSHEKYRM